MRSGTVYLTALIVVVALNPLMASRSSAASGKHFQCSILGISANAQPIVVDVDTQTDKQQTIQLSNPVDKYQISFSGKEIRPIAENKLKHSAKKPGSAIYYEVARYVKPDEKLDYSVDTTASGSLSDGDFAWIYRVAQITCNSK